MISLIIRESSRAGCQPLYRRPRSNVNKTDETRLFVAVPIPAALKRSAAEWTESLRHELPSFRKWVYPDDYHITLQFLGNVPQSRIQLLTEALKKAISPWREHGAPFELAIEGLGVFAGPRVQAYYGQVLAVIRISFMSCMASLLPHWLPLVIRRKSGPLTLTSHSRANMTGLLRLRLSNGSAASRLPRLPGKLSASLSKK